MANITLLLPPKFSCHFSYCCIIFSWQICWPQAWTTNDGPNWTVGDIDVDAGRLFGIKSVWIKTEYKKSKLFHFFCWFVGLEWSTKLSFCDGLLWRLDVLLLTAICVDLVTMKWRLSWVQ